MSIEESRQYHEERERIVDSFVKELQFESKNHKESVNSDHRQHELLSRFVEITGRLKDAYEDKSGLREKEIKKMSTNEISEFYSRLNEIKEYHKRNPDEAISTLSIEYDKYNKIRENPEEASAHLIDFTDEESYGRFLDLHESFQSFVNLKYANPPDYVTYLNTFDRLYEYPKDKKNVAYYNYISNLHKYLESFIERAKPMLQYTNIDSVNKMKEDFEKDWEEGKFKGWIRELNSALTQNSSAQLDLSTFNSPKELESLGLDRLKSALMAVNMKCGGTLEERAKRLWLTKNKSIDELQSSMKNLFKNKTLGMGKGSNLVSSREDQKKMAFIEAQIYYEMEILDKVRQETVENVQRKQARTLEELEEEDESEEEPEALIEIDTEESTAIYNPKNLPLDWDGKPIPYWLYKLHGLNMYYVCEICGNESYRGPKAFHQHFTEWRHAHGMRCLGIPNMPAFANITKIEEAIALWTKINNNKAELHHKLDEEEYEDSQGNVITKRVYDDLKREGLL